MKLALALSIFYLVVISGHATQWRDVKSQHDSPRYQEIVRKLFPELDGSEGSSPTGRITNGIQARLGEFPYQVYMYMFEPIGVAYLCGGSVI